jgi:hypothetical protein
MTRARLAASITIFLAAGGGLAGVASATSSSSQSSFVKRADAACAAAGAKVTALPAPTDATALADLKASRTIIATLVTRLKTVKAPAKHAKGYAKFIASTKEQGTLLGETLTAYDADQVSKITKLGDEVEAITTKGNEEASALGLAACAKNYTAGATTKPPTTTPTTTTTTTSPTTTTPTTTGTTPTVPTASPGSTPDPPSPSASGSSASSGSSSQIGTQTSSGSSSGGQSVNGILESSG